MVMHLACSANSREKESDGEWPTFVLPMDMHSFNDCVLSFRVTC